MTHWCGDELGSRIVEAFCRVRWSDIHPDIGPVRFAALRLHDPDEPCVRAACAHMLKAWERTGPKSGRACSSALFRGHTHRINADGQREYVPSNAANRWSAGGLSAKLKKNPKTLDRHCVVMEAAGIVDVWQPPAFDVPKDMRGVDYAYAIYDWRVPMPEPIARQLVAWWGGKQARAAAQQRQELPPAPEPGRTTPGAAATAKRLLERFGPPGPPPD